MAQTRKGPSNRTRRIITVTVLILILVGIIALIAHGCSKKSNVNEERASLNKNITMQSEQKDTIPEEATEAEEETADDSTDRFSAYLTPNYNKKYCIAVNTAQNIVTVYVKDPATGKYTKPYKAFICSTGLNGATPSGVHFTTYERNLGNAKLPQWHTLVGGVQGQWCTRIYSGILFHSVPYTAADPGKLQEGEYDKLGQPASHGCIRMTVADVKWIYDNIELGTCVNIYKDATCKEPLSYQAPKKIGSIPASDPRHGWDPTDPSAGNPWRR